VCKFFVNGRLIDIAESDSPVTSSLEETVQVQAASVQLDKEQIALYKGSREYRTITVERYSIGICLSTDFTHFHVYTLWGIKNVAANFCQ